MMELTKERLQQIVHAAGLEPWDYEEVFDGITTGEIVMMASQLLAGMEQEPVYQACKEAGVWVDIEPDDVDSLKANGEQVRELYAAPQLPQAVEPEITSEELDDELLEQLIDFRRDTLSYHKKEGNKVQTVMHGVVLRAMLELQERRAAMLQGAEPVTRKSDGASFGQDDPPGRGWVVTHDAKDYFYREQPDAVTYLNAALESGRGVSLRALRGEPASQPDAIDANLVEALRLVQCMLEDYRERNFGDAEGWIRHINTHMSDYSEAHGDDAYSVLHDLLPAAPQQEVTK